MSLPGYLPDEMVTSEPTRSSRLKWVVLVDSSLEAGRAANAVACVSAATAGTVVGLLGPGGPDADGAHHPGLPWAGCTVLAATSEQLDRAWETAVADEEIFVADMPLSAQTNRIYDEYLTELAGTGSGGIAASALSIVGPRKSIERITRKLRLL